VPGAGDVGIFEADGGFLLPERCVIAMVEQALRHGARLQTRERVRDVALDHDPIEVTTDRATYTARQLVVTAGPWLPALAPSLGLDLPLIVERQVQVWFAPREPDLYEPTRFPAFIHFTGDRAYYGLPHFGRPGVKICRHHGGVPTTADGVDRAVTRADEDDVRGYVWAHAPGADGPLLAAKVCLYTNTPDGHFLLGRHPGDARIVLAGGCSGHGFKFAPVVGEVIADLVLEGRSRFDLAMFEPGRFAGIR
jgi:monomeric sarcosine oxidase